MKKNDLWVGVFVFILFVGFASANHNALQIFLNIDGERTLDNASNTNMFAGDYFVGDYNSQIFFGHYVNEIIVNVDGEIKTLEEALNDSSLKNTFAGASPPEYDSTHGLLQFEYADNILVDANGTSSTLQGLVNDGYFYQDPICQPVCAIDSCGNADGCGGRCTNCSSGLTCHLAKWIGGYCL